MENAQCQSILWQPSTYFNSAGQVMKSGFMILNILTHGLKAHTVDFCAIRAAKVPDQPAAAIPTDLSMPF